MLSNSSQKSPSDPPDEISVLDSSDKKRASLQQEEKLDLSSSSGLDHRQNKTHVPKFSIRDYVCKSRSKNLNKNWPFSDKNLQLCLKNGVQNPLPPFQTPEEMRKELPLNQNATFPNPASKLGEEELPNALLSQPLIDPKSSVTKYPNSGEDSMNLQETMISKVCPVCKTFSSSSNTTLNAHIDQCLSVVSTKSSSSVIHRKIKARKIRLMADIYATAKHCTLEELELRNGRPWPPNEDHAIDLSENCNEGINQGEGSVYIDSNGTKLRILSGPELGNGDNNFHNPWKGGGGGKRGKNLSHLQKLPKIKGNQTLINSQRDLEAGKEGEEIKNDSEPTLQSMLLASMGKWPCAKRGFITSSRKSTTKRKHVVNEDSVEDCDVVLSTLRKLSSWGKRRRKLVVAESQSDSSRNSMAGQEHKHSQLPAELEYYSNSPKRGETENSHLQTGTITSLSNSIETKFSKLQLSPEEEVGVINAIGDDHVVTGRNLSELKQHHHDRYESDSPNIVVESTNIMPSQEVAPDYLSQISDSRLDILNPMPECFTNSGSNLQSSLEEIAGSGPNHSASPSSSTSVIRLMGKNLMVMNNSTDHHVIASPLTNQYSTEPSWKLPADNLISPNSHYRGSNTSIDQMIHCQPPNFDVHLGNGMRFNQTGQLRPPNNQETLQAAPVYNNIISAADHPQNSRVGSEALILYGDRRRLEQQTAPRMEYWNNSFYNYNRYHQYQPRPPAIPNANNFHVQLADEGTVANAHAHQMARWNRFGS